MRLRTVRIPYQGGDSFRLWPIGDIHLGSANCDVNLLDEVIGKVRDDPHAFWIGLGDMVESIAPNDKRWQAGGVDPNVVNLASQDRIGDVYVEKLANKLRPIADKLLIYGDGGHEEAFKKAYYTDLSIRVLEAIERPECYGGWASLTRMAFEDENNHRIPVRVLAQHGWQAGRLDGAKVNESRRLMAYIAADIYLSGHSHSKFVIPNTRLSVNNAWDHIRTETAFVAHTGSFLRTLQQDHVGYAERAGYPPTCLGPPHFSIQVFTDHAHIEGVV